MGLQLGPFTVPTLSSAPAVGVAGSLYYNTASNALFASTGAAWVQVGGSGGLTVSDTAPGSPSAGQMWLESDTGIVYIYYDSFWIEFTGAKQGNPGATGAQGQSTIPYSRPGALYVSTGVQRFRFPFAATILGVSAAVNTAPTGAAIIMDVNKNGTTIFTTQGNRPQIAASAYATAAEVTNMDVVSFAAGDYCTLDLDQVGSTVAGSELVALIRYTPT